MEQWCARAGWSWEGLTIPCIPDLDGTRGRFVARDPPSWCGLQTSVCPLSYSQTSNVLTQSSKGDSALVSLPGAQLVCWIQTLLSFSRVDCLPKPQLVHLIPLLGSFLFIL